MTFDEYVAARSAALVRVARLIVADDRHAEALVREALGRAAVRWTRIARTERPDVALRRLLVAAAPRAPVATPDTDPVWAGIARLPGPRRAVLALRHYEDLDDVVIAEIMDCSPATVRAHAHRALAALGVPAEAVTASLRRRATSAVETVTLIDEATRHGRALRKRGRLVRRVAMAAVVLLAITGLAAVARPRSPDGPVRFDGVDPYLYGDTRLPRATGVPGARLRPGAVGSDPAVLHFDAAVLTLQARRHTWTSGPGYEQLDLAIGYDDIARVTIAGDPSVLDAVARPGANLKTVRTERPTAGLWLRVLATGDRLAGEVAQSVDIDHAQRCVLPFRLPVRPAGAGVSACYVGFQYGHYAEGGLVLRAPRGRSMEVQAQYEPGFPNRKTVNHACGGRPAFVYPGGQEVELLGDPSLYVSARIGRPYAGYGIADADAVLAALGLAPDVERMQTWPRSPVSP